MIYLSMVTKEITSIFLAVVLVAGTITIASPYFISDADATGNKKKHDRYDDYDGGYKKHDRYDKSDSYAEYKNNY